MSSWQFDDAILYFYTPPDGIVRATRKGCSVMNNELRLELLQMAKEDQEVRRELTPVNFANLTEKIVEIDSKNTSRMREIVQEYGWPGKNLVGEDGTSAAWLLVQHADRDRKFQKQCLELMKETAKKGEVPLQNVAYLTDRLLIAEGKRQVYGTQFEIRNGKPVLFPIEDEVNVDKRRKEVGLPSLKEYKKIAMKHWEMNQSQEPDEK